jgi:serine/threonine-protein kinase HipA
LAIFPPDLPGVAPHARGEIRHNAMKLAMAVGDNRHYVIDSIMPRHFLQTAASCGVPASLVQTILDEIENDTDRAIDAAVNDLPSGFPERIVSSVIDGMRRRLFAHAIGNIVSGETYVR